MPDTHKFVGLILLCVWTGAAGASTCPAFFRFVDFGQTGRDGVVYRGGSFFRAEGPDGTPLLSRERTECLPVTDLGKDGRGNPIPVVQSIHYKPEVLPAGIEALRVSAFTNAIVAAEESAVRHHTRLQQPGIKTIRGDNYLCLTDDTKALLSCQVVSPYADNAALVAYCEGGHCRMPLMVVDSRIAVSAVWSRRDSDDSSDAGAADVVDRIGGIHTFLSPLISLSP